ALPHPSSVGPRSVPRPSAPWHTAQSRRNNVRTSGCAVEWADPPPPNTATAAATATATTGASANGPRRERTPSLLELLAGRSLLPGPAGARRCDGLGTQSRESATAGVARRPPG